jgi:NTE family protein
MTRQILGCSALFILFLAGMDQPIYAQDPAFPASHGPSNVSSQAGSATQEQASGQEHPPHDQLLQKQPAGTIGIENPAPRIEGAPPGVSRLPATVPAGRPVIGLALEGGGALGLAHIGVLKWFEEHHIPVDRLAGTSMGALVGGIYASGRSAEEVERLATNSNFGDVFTFETPYTDLSYRRRQDRRELPQGIQLGLRHGVNIRNALLTDRGLDGYLHQNFVGYNSRSLDYNQLPIPFRCVATDLNDLGMVVFAGGPMNVSIRASISIPGIFPPVRYHDNYMVDGAIVDNLPVDIAKSELHSDVIIAVALGNTPFAPSDVDSIVGVFARAFSAGTARNVSLSIAKADILLTPGLDKFSVSDYGKAEEMISQGYKAAEEHRAELLKYSLNDADWAAYMADRNSRRHAPPGLLETLKIEGGSQGAREKAQRDLAPLKEQPIDQGEIFTALGKVQGNGAFEAGFDTFNPNQKQDVNSVQAPGPDTGVLVHLNPVRNGPPFLIFGADLSAMNSNVTRGTFDLRLIDQNLGGYGSELRSDLRLGFVTQASAEYYRLLTHNGFFLQPHLGLLREPVYLWTNQIQSAEYFQQEVGGGLDFGRTFNRNMQISAEWRAQAVRWHLQLGPEIEPDLSGASQTAVVHYVYDNTTSGTLSPRGMHLDVSGGALYNSLASQNAPLFQLGVAKTTTLGDKNIFGASANINTYFRRNVAEPLRFTLGGPLWLSASSIDEYRGTDDYLVRGGYLRQIASLPSGLGQGIYLSIAYEAGEMWSPQTPAFLREDVVTGVVAATPLGVITFGGSVGDAGRRKVFFTLGRLF